VDDKTAGADIERQPIAAANAAAFAFTMLGAIAPEDIGRLSQDPEDPDSGPLPEAPAWASVPFSTAELLQRAIESHHAEAGKLLSILAKAKSNPASTVDELLRTPPPGLFDADSDLLWAAIGEFALGHGLHSSASEAFDKAAEAGGDKGLWLSLSALERSVADGGSGALDQLDKVTTESKELPTSLVRAVVQGNAEAILSLTADADGTCLRPSAYRVQALQVEGRLPEAIGLALRLVELHPAAAGSILLLAKLLMQGAREDSSPLGYDASLLRARELALDARDLRRGWGGDSIDPAFIAGAASIQLRDAASALHISSAPPEGSAWSLEASNDHVRQIRVDALMLLGREDDALSEAPSFSDEIKRKLVEADCLSAMGRKGRAEELYVAAIDALEPASLDDPEVVGRLLEGLMGLADLGVFPLPSIDRLRATDSEAARRVEIQSDIARGKMKAAVRAARKSGLSSDVALLVDALTKAGQTDDAVSILKDAASRFGRNGFLLQVVRLLAREERFAEAYKESVDALAVVPDGTPLKLQLRKTAVQTAAMIPAWDAVLKQAKAAIAAGERSDDMRWALVIAQSNTFSPEAALAEATSEPALAPRTEQEAQLLISLHATRGQGLDSIAAVLDAAEAYPGSEEIGAAAVGSVMVLSRDVELPPDTRERLTRASENFFERYPESGYLMRIEGTPEKIIEFLEASGDPWHIPAVQEVVDKIGAGALPLPLLTAVSNKPYAELLVKRGVGWIVGESRDRDVRQRERRTALESVGHSVVLETSAVCGVMLTELSMDDLLGLFPQTIAAQASTEDAIRGASTLALRSTSSMRWDSLRGSLVLDESTSEDADRWASEAQQIERALRGSTSKVPVGRLDDVAKSPLVLQPVQLAKELGLALYSDDVAIRMLAASEGVPAFGTVSILAAAQEHGFLDAEQVAAGMDALRRNRYCDLDWATEDLLRIAETEGFAPQGGAAGALARPVFWSDPIEASDSYRSLLIRMAEARIAPGALGGWQAAATFGFLGSLDPILRGKAAGLLLAAGFLALGLQPAALPPLLDGARQGAGAREAGDPVPDFCRRLANALSSQFGEAQGGGIYVEMMQQLDPEDKAVALRELITRKEPEAKGGYARDTGDAQ
jgi:hypothetical protein